MLAGPHCVADTIQQRLFSMSLKRKVQPPFSDVLVACYFFGFLDQNRRKK